MRPIPKEIRAINKFLSSPGGMEGRCGVNHVGLSKYRVAWAPDLLSWQEGPFHDYDENTGLVTNVSTEPRQMPKYGNSGIGDQWVLEWLMDDRMDGLELNKDDRYEMIHAFREGFTPSQAHIEVLLNAQFNPERLKPDPKTVTGSPEKQKRDQDLMLDIMEDYDPWLASQLREGHGVFLDSTKRFTA